MKVNDRIVWIELATSGDDPESASLERVTVRITDKELEPVAELPATTIDEPDG